MATVTPHDADHLAPICVWMAGGLDRAFELGAADLAGVPGTAEHAVDLGAGFGMHAIPLARAGTRVLAIDTTEPLLASLARSGRGLPVETVNADLADFASHSAAKPDLILCVGNALTHLASPADVSAPMRAVAKRLCPGGSFLATLRDDRKLPTADNRFISVRGDERRIHTCFLEEQPRHVIVHDLVHERVSDEWQLRVGSCPKLRLDPREVLAFATAAGPKCRIEPGSRDMVKLGAGSTA